MALDTVHDIQCSYRRLVHAMSFPGTVVRLGPYAERMDLDLLVPKPMLLLALTLLDAEVSFAVVSGDVEGHTREMAHLTSASPAAIPEGDFLFVLDPSALADTVSAAKPGTLIAPHTGATVIAAVDAVEETGPLTLSGPGIESRRHIGVQPAQEWVGPRAEKNREYPMGVDVLLVAANGDLVALPRTTQIVEQR